jgi:hypothetical protein
MGKCGAQYRIGRVVAVEPGKESTHLAIDTRRVGGFIMNALATYWAGDDLHEA